VLQEDNPVKGYPGSPVRPSLWGTPMFEFGGQEKFNYLYSDLEILAVGGIMRTITPSAAAAASLSTWRG
jgi:hypothetical protein